MMWILINTPGPTGVEGASPSSTSRQGTTTRPHRCGGRRRVRRAWSRCRWVAAGPGRASRSTTPSRRLACGDLAGGPPPTGTHSGPAHQGRPPAPGTPAGHKHQHAAQTARGRAAAHRHTERPDRTRQIMRSGWRAYRAARPDTTRGARNTHGATQQLKPQKHNEKCPLKHQHSQLHSNTPKSHMRNMRAS